MIKTCYMRFPVFTKDLWGYVLLCLILDAKIPKFTYVKFEKKLKSSQGTVDLNMYNTGHFKTI